MLSGAMVRKTHFRTIAPEGNFDYFWLKFLTVIIGLIPENK